MQRPARSEAHTALTHSCRDHTSHPVVPHTQVTQGIYHHNVHGAGAAVAAGVAEPEDFRFFAQYAGWAPGQLEDECRSGVWFCTAASPSLTLNQELSSGGSMWHAILQVMGGEAPGLGSSRSLACLPVCVSVSLWQASCDAVAVVL